MLSFVAYAPPHWVTSIALYLGHYGGGSPWLEATLTSLGVRGVFSCESIPGVSPALNGELCQTWEHLGVWGLQAWRLSPALSFFLAFLSPFLLGLSTYSGGGPRMCGAEGGSWGVWEVVSVDVSWGDAL